MKRWVYNLFSQLKLIEYTGSIVINFHRGNPSRQVKTKKGKIETLIKIQE